MNGTGKALVAGAASLCLAAAVGQKLRGGRSDAGEAGVSGAAAASGKPPALVTLATVALGGFRGVAADMLWLRAGRLQEQRRFVELVQLSEWITALEPEAPQVWSFHAWNLAYNVTILLGRPDDRWRWVENAISLLRDRGAELNPQSPEIKRELAWLFLHKLGTDSDSAAGHYRTVWARQIAGWLKPDGSAPDAGSMQGEELCVALKMDPERMAALERRFGRIDWRMPEASALYWGDLAVDCAGDGREKLHCRRMVYSALLSMMRHHGFCDGDPTLEDWTFRAVPNFSLALPTGDYIEQTMAEHSFSGIRYAYVGWLRDAIMIALAESRTAEAEALYAKLVSFFAERGVGDVPALSRIATAPDGIFSTLLEKAGFR